MINVTYIKKFLCRSRADSWQNVDAWQACTITVCSDWTVKQLTYKNWILICISCIYLFLTPNIRSVFRAGVSLNIHSFILLFSTSEKVKKEREKERREQYKQVRAHVKKDDGRMQAYGWSLPAKFIPQASKESQGGKSGVPVPVPVYCRPLLDKETGLKVKQLFVFGHRLKWWSHGSWFTRWPKKVSARICVKVS